MLEKFNYKGFTVEIGIDIEGVIDARDAEDDVFILAFDDRFYLSHPRCRNPEGIESWKKSHEFFALYAYFDRGLDISLVSQPTRKGALGQVGHVLVHKNFPDAEKMARYYLSGWGDFLAGDLWYYRVLDKDREAVSSHYHWGYEDCHAAACAACRNLKAA